MVFLAFGGASETYWDPEKLIGTKLRALEKKRLRGHTAVGAIIRLTSSFPFVK